MIVSSVVEQPLIHYYFSLPWIFNTDTPDEVESKWTEHARKAFVQRGSCHLNVNILSFGEGLSHVAAIWVWNESFLFWCMN